MSSFSALPNAAAPTATQITAAPCEHHALSVYQSLGGWPEDHDIERGRCHCGAWIERTSFANGDIEERALSTHEITALKALRSGMV